MIQYVNVYDITRRNEWALRDFSVACRMEQRWKLGTRLDAYAQMCLES
jgi:hypothetical protein